jgi:type IV secretory pathway TraG/TraD family ATPase VirD4
MRGMISMLTDHDYRHDVVSHIKDDMVKKFWAVEFTDSDVIISLVNKLEQFLSDPMLRNIFKQTENKVDIEKLMNEQKILLVNLSKGKIGEDNSSLLGSMFITKIKQAGVSRAKVESRNLSDFYLYIDEFHSIITDTFENMLSEASNYGINLILAHQYVGQISSKVAQAVLGNTGSIVLFRVGGDDATKLKSEFAPVFDVKDMINLGIGEFYIKMIIDGESYDPFSAETLRVLPSIHSSYKKEIIEASRRKYAIRREEIENN